MDTRRLDDLLAAARRLGATALHLVPGRAPALRVQRRFVAAGDEAPVEPTEVDELLRDMLFSDHREQLERLGYVEVLYVARSGDRYRATVAGDGDSHALLLRPVPSQPPDLASLELPSQFEALTRCRRGLVAVSGFFGAGKSTTLAALVDSLNRDAGRHIVTIEDSIQVVHSAGAALLHQRQIGSHIASAAEGVRQALAVGVDTIVVNEVKDAATLDAVLTAAEAGCLVFVGVEAGSVVGALAQLSGMAPVEAQPRLRARLSRALRAVTAQTLLQRSHKSGRVPVVEVLVGSRAVRAAVRDGDLHALPEIMQRCRGLGMQTNDIALRELLNQHLVSEEEALLHASNRDQVRSRAPVR